ncbi:bifunctional phosphatase PAP2/diacylglycerol kinase family protein [Williamsia deligens]|uniref:Bifunctional phosphatase PAP2/diacylglycerol kinase family protein n=1 Tax=Williamsia deligens TaxID=321325 RepID=A0ABW3G702_9NOCA
MNGRSLRHRRQALRTAVDTADRAAYLAVARAESPLLDAPMRRLTVAANYSRLWFAIAALLAATRKSSALRAAARGVTSVAVSSLVTNQIAKRVFGRRRPVTDAVPIARLIRTPTSGSMPSGHSASAAAFTVAVAIEKPALGVAVAPLAAAVGLSRVATGAHYPGDVVVGLATGAGIAWAMGELFPPMSSHLDDAPEPTWVDVPARPDGEGVVMVVNPASGGGTGSRVVDVVESRLPRARIVTLAPDEDLTATLVDAARDAEILGIAGGDGTVGAAAATARDRGIPLAVFPAGTFNHFAKDIGCATVDDTVRAIHEGRAAAVDLALLNDHAAFVNTANIGTYPQFVRFRERYEKRVGKPIAAIIALLHVLRRERPVRLRVDGREISTSMFFIGASTYETPGFAPAHRPHMDDGVLDVRLLDVGRRWAIPRIMVAALTGRLDRSRLFRETRVSELEVVSLDGPTSVALDGEVRTRTDRAHFRVAHRALTVYGTWERD